MGLLNALVISGYKDPLGTQLIGLYKLQLNPSELKITVGEPKVTQTQDSLAGGTAVTSKATVFQQRTLVLSFTIDNTGAVPHSPFTPLPGGNIVESIKTLELVAVNPIFTTHRPPFVRLAWGKGLVNFKGIVSSFDYSYTFFDGMGIPLRAVVNMTVKNFDTNDKSLYQSPDITKMPVIKDGDNIVKISEEYYDDKKYYIKLAEFNNLSSFRALKFGSQLEIPPIK
jgi:nucleoid-associated protein YgaU